MQLLVDGSPRSGALQLANLTDIPQQVIKYSYPESLQVLSFGRLNRELQQLPFSKEKVSH